MSSTTRAVDNQREIRRIVGDPLPNVTTSAALFGVDKSDASFRRDVHTERSYSKHQQEVGVTSRGGSQFGATPCVWPTCRWLLSPAAAMMG